MNQPCKISRKDSSSTYESALLATYEELQDARSHLQDTEHQAHQARIHVEELESLAHQLIARLPKDRTPELNTKLFGEQTNTPKLNARGGPICNNVVELFVQNQQREWTAPDLQEALASQGEKVRPKAIHNVLNYLERTGRLERVSRGRYVIKGHGILVTTGEDISSCQ